ncbi:MAG TPA: allantoinase AllB [Streptosporangiaceae bacterium]|nr:allantoinase AllB [Streptosporangiaceae bacterium]
MTQDLKYDLVVRSRRAVLPGGERPAAVAVRDGRIAVVAPVHAPLDGAHEEDLAGLALLPGLVDVHVHAYEPGRADAEEAGFTTATAAAAAGGVTTIVDMPVPSLPSTVSVAALHAVRAAAAGRCAVDVGLWGAVVPGNVAELGPLRDAGVVGFKCFLAGRNAPFAAETSAGAGGGADGSVPLDKADLRAAFASLAALGPDTLISVHAEDWSEIRQAHGRSYATYLASRPPRAERRAIEQVVAAAAATGVRAHIAHLSAAECVALIAGAKAAGIALTAETCPHYLLFAAEEVPDGATEFKCLPPIRDGINREALWRGLEGGVIDCVASGHSPPDPRGQGTQDAANAGDFGAARGGIAGLQLSLPAVWTVARWRRHGLTDVIRWMAERPAALAGLPLKGRIEVGCDADLVAFDPDAEFTVRGTELLNRNPVTPYEGRVLAGVVRAVWLRGERIDAGAARRGHLITRAKG